MPLPTIKEIPSDSLADYTILIAGEKNAGKTSFAAQFPNHFIFEFEPGNAKHLSCVYRDIPDLKTFEKWLKEAENDPNPHTIIIDEVQKLYDLCYEQLLKEEGVDDPKDLGWAKGWIRIAARFNKYITRLQALPGGNIYTAHSVTKELERRGGGKLTKICPKFGAETTRFKDKYLHICGMIMFTDKGQREFILQGDDIIEASCKLLDDHFYYNSGQGLKRSIAKFPMGRNAVEAYDNFTKAFANKLEVFEENYVPITSFVQPKKEKSKKKMTFNCT